MAKQMDRLCRDEDRDPPVDGNKLLWHLPYVAVHHFYCAGDCVAY